MMYRMTSDGEANKLALGGRESYLLFYKIATLLLTLNLVLLGAQWVIAMFLLPEARGFFAETAAVIVIFLVVFAVWMKPSIEYHLEMARELSEKGELAASFKVQFYLLLENCHWQVFARYSKIWSYLALALGLLSVALGCTAICLIALASGDKIAFLAQTAWITVFWLSVVQMSYCLLAHKTIVALTEKEEDGR